MAITKFRPYNARGISEWEYPLAAGVKIEKGDILITSATGLRGATGVSGDGPAIGWAIEARDNTGGAAGAKGVVITFGRVLSCVEVPLSATAPPTTADRMVDVFVDSASLATKTAGNRIGKLVDILPSGVALVAVNL